jgi:predicted PurR-regulated permease PerM
VDSKEEQPAGQAPAPVRPLLPPALAGLLIAALSWYLLKEFAGLLRPMLIAFFIGYLILPPYHRLRQRVSGPTAFLLMAFVSVGIIYLLALLIYGSVVSLEEDLEPLSKNAQKLYRNAHDFVAEHMPWLATKGEGPKQDLPVTELLQRAARNMAASAAQILLEAIIIGFYLLFMLLEASRFPERIRGAFQDERAQEILGVVGRINDAMVGFLKVKVKASLYLAIPVTIALWLFGVKFAMLWGVLTFFGNFIPYVGSFVACILPIGLAFLQLDLGPAVAVAVLLLIIHNVTAYVIEPTMTGRAIDLSPLVILISLAFWAECWGLAGMLLAVPLTVMLKIVLENIPATRPLGRMLGE